MEWRLGNQEEEEEEEEEEEKKEEEEKEKEEDVFCTICVRSGFWRCTADGIKYVFLIIAAQSFLQR